MSKHSPLGRRPVHSNDGVCLIFDCDGVLVDSELIVARIAAEFFCENGIAITAADIVDRFAGVGAQKVTEILAGEAGVVATAAMTGARGRRVLAALDAELASMPGVKATLTAIPLPKCVASSSHPERIRRSLEISGLARLFGDAVFSAAQVERGKPAPDLFLFAAARMGADPMRCIVVEDSVVGVAAGVAAGMTVIGFTGGSHCGPNHGVKLAGAGAARVIAHMDDLRPAVVEIAVGITGPSWGWLGAFPTRLRAANADNRKG
jgi:HAD superfamily hydrolase (TIGR01509 family)